MDGIEYEKEAYSRPLTPVETHRSWAVGLVMKFGGKYARTEEQANRILIIVTVIFFSLSIYNFFF